MKNKTLKIVLMLVLAILLAFSFVACDKKPQTPPAPPPKDTVDDGGSITSPDKPFAFTLTMEVYPWDKKTSKVITLTKDNFTNVPLSKFSYESKGKTTFYKGYKVSEIVSTLPETKDIVVENIFCQSSDSYNVTSALPKNNFANTYFAVLQCDTEKGAYVTLDNTKDGDIRLFDLSLTNYLKSIKFLSKLYINQPSIAFVKDDGTALKANISTKTLTEFTVGETAYKGIKISDLLNQTDNAELKALSLSSIKFEDATGYSSVLDVANFENAYLAVMYKKDATSPFTILENGAGPVRLFDTTTNTSTKSVKGISKFTFNIVKP